MRYSVADIIQRPLFFPLIFFILLIIGYDSYDTRHFSAPTILPQRATYTGRIIEGPDLKEEKIKITVALEKRVDPDPIPLHVNALLTILDDTNSLKLGDRIRFTTKLKSPTSYQNPGGFDYVRFLRHKRIALTGLLQKGEVPEMIESANLNLGKSFAHALKEKIKNETLQTGLVREAGILMALLWGDESLINKTTWDLFRNAGLAHLLVISGLHFATLAAIIFFFFLLIGRLFPPLFLHLPFHRLAAGGTWVLLTAYYAICEVSPSVTRSYVAVSCYLFALILGKTRDMLNILFLAALVILLIQPFDLFDLSFQFSFLAVLSLALIFPRLKDFFTKPDEDNTHEEEKWLWRKGKACMNGLRDLILVNVSVLIGLAPVMIFYFHTTQWNGLLMNLWAVPAIELIIVPLGLLALGLMPVLPFFPSLLLYFDLHLINGVYRFLEWCSLFLPTPRLMFPPHGWELFFYYFLLLVLFLKISGRIKTVLAALILIIFSTDAVLAIYQAHHTTELSLTQLDVGQGDSILVNLPGTPHVLIDGGGSTFFDVGQNVLIPYLLYERIPRLSAVCVTHADTDHYLGLISLLENYPVDELWWNGLPNNAASYQLLFETARRKGIRIVPLHQGMKIDFGKSGLFTVLSPEKNLPSNSKDNNASVVLRLDSQTHRALFTGDIEKEREMNLVETNAPALKSDYLKVPHHGSHSSSSLLFLHTVAPQVATLGTKTGNRFGHPHPEIVQRYEELGIPLHRTDREGAIEVKFQEGGDKSEALCAIN